jgi:hypothetical protein
MSQSTLGKLIRFHTQAVLAARAAVVEVADDVGRRSSVVAGDRFLSPSEKEREFARIRSDAARRIPGLVQAARDAHDEACRFIAHELRKIEPSEVARSRVRRLLDRDAAPSTILAQALELGDRDTLAALRDDLAWGLGPSSDEFMRELDHSIARLAGGEGERFEQLLQLRDAPAIDEAQRLALAATTETMLGGVPRARIAYALATGQTGDGDGGDEGDVGGGEE